MTAAPAGYPFSSVRAHFGLVKSDLISDDLFDSKQREECITFIRGEADEDRLKDIRSSLKTGGPLTDNKCLKAIEEKLAGRRAAQPVGDQGRRFCDKNGMCSHLHGIFTMLSRNECDRLFQFFDTCEEGEKT